MSRPLAPYQSFDSQFSACTTADECIWKALTVSCTELEVQAGTIFKVDPAKASLEVLHTFGVLPWRVAKSEFSITQGICGWVSQHKEPAIVNDVKQDPRFNQQVDLVTQFQTVSVLCVPFVVEGLFFGVVELINRHERPFTESDLAQLQNIIASAAARLQLL